MSNDKQPLPQWIYILSFYSSLISTCIIIISIYLHLKNYRKPFQQRLMIRIQLIVPLFALSCYSMLIDQNSIINKFILEPIREVYEAFVIYTFFSLLTDMLGGERQIIIMTSGRPPVEHPGIVKAFLPPLDLSDSYTFLMIKRGILQYVWLKPLICIMTILSEILGLYNVNNMTYKSVYFWLTLLYNFSVTLSLYCLAIFWKILWNDLKPFKPVGKFLCVKLIIFASYWQGIILAILNYFQILPGVSDENFSIGLCIQNALLCIELIGFSIGHWYSFSYYPFTISQLPWARVKFVYAMKDWLGFRDLISDFGLTYHGDYYKDYRTFDSVEAMIAHPDSKGRMSRIHQGLRYHYDGKQKHWLPETQSIVSNATLPSTSEIHAFDASSMLSNTTSMKGIYPINSITNSPPSSPELNSTSIQNMLQEDSFLAMIDYSMELFDDDERLYKEAMDTIGNYSLEDKKIKKLLNYPVVDEVINSHVYGYKVQQLRNNQRLRQKKKNDSGIVQSNQSYRYGSIV